MVKSDAVDNIDGVTTYPKPFCLCEELRESLRGLNTNGVPSKMDLFDYGWIEVCEVGRDVRPGIELQTLAQKRKSRHDLSQVVLKGSCGETDDG